MRHWVTSLLAWHGFMSEDVHAYVLLLVSNHWPWLLDELLLQPPVRIQRNNNKKKYDFKPICPLGSILKFHIGIRL